MQMLARAFHHHFRAEDLKYSGEKECKKKARNTVSVIKTSGKACCRFHHLVLVQFHLFKMDDGFKMIKMK